MRLLQTNTFAGETYLIKQLGFNFTLVKKHRPQIPAERFCVDGAVRGTVAYGAEYWTATGRSDMRLSYYTHDENIKHIEQRPASECTVRMLTG
jgi:hypothetical protein